MFKTSLVLSGKADTTANIITHLQSFEVTLRRDSGINPDSGLIMAKKARDQHRSEASPMGKGLVGYECAEKGNKMISCPNRDKWAYAEQKVKGRLI
jgi:hypothetical protein